MDIKSREERSLNMSKIRGANTKPEVYIRSLLHKKGLRYRVNYSGVLGKPDVYFVKKKVAVFVHGCYWHRHQGCKYAYTPKSNQEFWLNKLESNRQRDNIVVKGLKEQGVRVLVIWECTVKQMKKSVEKKLEMLDEAQKFVLSGTTDYLEL